MTGEDLSGGGLSPHEENLLRQELKEDSHRLIWKNTLLCIGVLVVLALYFEFIALVKHFECTALDYTHTVMLLAVVTIPTLLLIKLIGIIAHNKHYEHKDDKTVLNMWFELLKELVNAVSKKLGRE